MTTFFAYPGNPKEISDVARMTLRIIQDEFKKEGYRGWEANDIAGRYLVDPILQQIDSCTFLAADITFVNFNVVYEIGYAIGKQRRVLLTKNSALSGDDNLIKEVGIFDTLGYREYQQSRTLASIITGTSDVRPLQTDYNVNARAPVYVVLPKNKMDLDIHLLSRIKKAKLYLRSFDGEEQGRMSALDAIKNVALSYGVIVPLLPNSRKDAQVHNIRGAFVAGLANGMGKELLFLQFGDSPVPLDVRDVVAITKTQSQIDKQLADFAPSIMDLLQSEVKATTPGTKTLLARLNLGASAAENEIADLGEYYIETDEFRRALRGEVQIVAGRKGSGKTALFVILRDNLRRHRQHVILDLKPEAHQLLKFKDLILAYLEQGTREHTIAAFWEYLLLLEICHKIIEKDRDLHKTNHELLKPYQELAQEYQGDPYVSEGDFAERMLKLTQRIMKDFKEVVGSEKKQTRLNTEELTNLLYKHDMKLLRDRLSSYLQHKRELWILFDNIDKGWPSRGLGEEDVMILRSLLDAMSKLDRYLKKGETAFRGIVFIRNDVYELLLKHTADRGKTSRVVLDWTDQELLRELLRRRLVANDLKPETPFLDVWQSICVSHVGVDESSTYLIDRCLMRPRSLIELVYQCRSHAVNLGHSRIEVADIQEGEVTYSNDLVINLGFEINDVLADAADVLYEFVGSSVRQSHQEIMDKLAKLKIVGERAFEIVDALLWFCFFGVVREDETVSYIYSVNYNMKHLRALVKAPESAVYYINPAFWAGLEVVK